MIKKLSLSILLHVAFVGVLFAQTVKIPAVKSSVKVVTEVYEVTFTDGIKINVTGANNATVRKPLYLAEYNKQKAVSSKLKLPVPLYLTNLQIPYEPAMNSLFNEVDTPPQDFYGALLPENITYQDFPSNSPLPIIESFEMGGHVGNHSGREFRIFGVNADQSEELLATYVNAGVYKLTKSKAYTRLKYVIRGNARPNYLKIFAISQPYTAPKVEFVKYPLGNHMGTNAHPYNLLEDPTNANIRDHITPSAMKMLKLMGRVRLYEDNVNVSVTKDEYYFDKDRQGYFTDNMMKELKDSGIHVVWCMQGLTQRLHDTYPNQNNSERVPVAYGADRMDPKSWADYAEIGYQIALRYGSNSKIDTSKSKSKTGNFWQNAPQEGGWTKKVGLGYLTEIEPYNEIDKWWKGLDSYASGKEMAVAMNVIYQRIKDADPNMQVTYPGLASFSPDILKEFVYWSMKLYNRIPVDNYAYHVYPSTAGGQYSAGQNRGSVPELYSYPDLMKNFREAVQVRLGNKPFDCGETGFDSSEFSPLRAVPPTGSGYNQRQWAAVMYARTALFNAKNGVRATYHYQFSDLNKNDQWTQFAVMGMTKQNGGTLNPHEPQENLNLLSQIKEIAGQYTQNTEVSAVPLVDKWVSSKDVVYSVYSATENNTKVNYSLKLPGVKSVTKYELKMGTTVPTKTVIPIIGEVLNIKATETPTFIKVN